MYGVFSLCGFVAWSAFEVTHLVCICLCVGVVGGYLFLRCGLLAWVPTFCFVECVCHTLRLGDIGLAPPTLRLCGQVAVANGFSRHLVILV